MVVKKIRQRIGGWLRHPSVAVAIGCLKIGEGIRTSLDVAGFLRAWISGWVNGGVLMSVQTGLYLAMAVTVAYAIVVAALAIRSRRREDEMARRQRSRRAGTLRREKR